MGLIQQLKMIPRLVQLCGGISRVPRVVEVMKDGSTRPYPTDTWARAPQEDADGLNGVLGLRADREGILWMLDGQGENQTGRVVGWNTRTETLQVTFDSDPTRSGGGAITFTGEMEIDRRDYGMRSYQLIVGNKVDIRLRARMVPR